MCQNGIKSKIKQISFKPTQLSLKYCCNLELNVIQSLDMFGVNRKWCPVAENLLNVIFPVGCEIELNLHKYPLLNFVAEN